MPPSLARLGAHPNMEVVPNIVLLAKKRAIMGIFKACMNELGVMTPNLVQTMRECIARYPVTILDAADFLLCPSAARAFEDMAEVVLAQVKHEAAFHPDPYDGY